MPVRSGLNYFIRPPLNHAPICLNSSDDGQLIPVSSAYLRTMFLIDDARILGRIPDKAFRLSGRKAVAASERSFEVVLIDATETPIEQSKKDARYYSGKEKRHTLKTQLVVEKSMRRILRIAHEKGRRHDFRPFKTSKLRLNPKTTAVVDSGYQGLQRTHANTAMPKKRSKKIRYPQAIKSETAPSPANVCHARSSSPC